MTPGLSRYAEVSARLVMLVVTLLSFEVTAAEAQLVASGQSLVVTTPHAVARFAGADLIGLVNVAANEASLDKPSQGELAAVNAIGFGGPMQSGSWTIAPDPGTGQPIATITGQGTGRTLALTVRIDPVTQEIVLRLTASVASGGLRDASWSIAGLDLANGRLIVPAHSGLVFDRDRSGIGTFIQYPNTWQAQMLVYESARGSIIVYSTDSSYAFKQLRIGTRGSGSIDVAVATEAQAPFPTAATIPAVEWRLKAVAGDWRAAAGIYRDWLLTNRPPLSEAAHAWVSNIRTVAGIRGIDPNVLAPLAATVVPSQTLLYIHDWRRDAYDVNYPDYTPRAGVSAFVAAARALGFKVMLHVDLVGVSPSNPAYDSVQQHQARNAETLERLGWRWEMPPSTPFRFAIINPASPQFRQLFIDSVRTAVDALNPDALHLDISAPMVNDGNGPIGGLSYPQGSTLLHEQLSQAFPSLALGGEGENDILYRYHAFAQAWYFAEDAIGHPITTFLFSPKVQYYGHLGQPPTQDPAFREDLLRLQRRAVLPQLTMHTPADLDASNVDNARLLAIINQWQTHAFKPAWTADWSGALVRYEGLNGATAEFRDTATMSSLTAGATTLFGIAHDVERLTTPSFIRSWPAFDATTVHGLDRTKKYFVDPLPRPAATHITSLPPDIRLGPGTLVGAAFANVELRRQSSTAFDFLRLIDAHIGVHDQGADTPLGNGAVMSPSQITVAGVSRAGLVVHPPWHAQIGGEAFVEYLLPIPPGAHLEFFAGVADHASCSDGVTFRVGVGGVELWRRHIERSGSIETIVSLAAYGGQTAAVRLSVHPGAANHTGCDTGVWSRVALVTPPALLLVDVPVALEPGGSAAGFDGDGSLSIESALAVTARNVTVPGVFTLFTRPGPAAIIGTNLATVPFEIFQSARDELPRPGAAFGAGSVGATASGGVSKSPAIFAHPPNGQTTLAWVVRLPADALRLAWSAGLADDSFSDDGVDFVVRVNGVAYWHATVQTHGWRSGAIDLSRWRDQSILIELVTDSRTNPGWDWAYWADLVLSAGAGCSYGFGGSGSILPAGGSFSIPVTTASTCPWRATSNVPWLVVSGASGQGSGSVAYTALPNPGGTRTGIVSLAGHSFIVIQVAVSLFTDDPLSGAITPIRAAHVTELRTRIDALRVRHGLGAFPWRDPALSVGSPIRAMHVIDLRAAIAEVHARLGRPLTFSDPSLQPGMTMKTAHIQEIRGAVLAIE